MRFVSHITKFGVGILPRRVEILGGGVEREIQPLFVAQFIRGDLHAEEAEMAQRIWRQLPGFTTEVDEVTITPHFKRLSTYDTESRANLDRYAEIDRAMEGEWMPGGRAKWEPGATKKLVEQKLSAKAVVRDMFFQVEQAPVVAPWPLYDAFPGTAEDLLEVLQAQGHNLVQALAYERQHEQRPEVMERLEAAIAEEASALGADVEEFVVG